MWNFEQRQRSGQADCARVAMAEWYAERLIGTIRRECVDHLIVFGEAHLRRNVREYAAYYNGVRTHRALDLMPPSLGRFRLSARSHPDPFSAVFIINIAESRFSTHTGLRHQYVRI
jgi:hypothetical protein